MASAPPQTPAALRWAVGFFSLSGVLEFCLTFADARSPDGVALWEALGRATLHWVLALGLWHRFSLCRTVAAVYCLAALVMYLVVLGLALGGAPLRFAPSVIVESLVQVPSCVLLLPWLRSGAAARALPRPLLWR